MTNKTVSYLQEEYRNQKVQFEGQPAILQRFLESQARLIAEALTTKAGSVRFALPDRVLIQNHGKGQARQVTVPEVERPIRVTSFLQNDVRPALMQRLDELEKSTHEGISVSTALLRYATAIYMVHDLLPDGRSVTYRPCGDEQIPSLPVGDHAPESAITQASDAIVEEGSQEGRGPLQTPFVPAARKFFMPQWVAFDEEGKLLVGSVQDAEAQIRSMQNYFMVLHRALSLAPYISTNEEYQRKRYGILGQLINQGRALADFKTNEMISEIKQRAERQSLNRGLSAILPYFDDQSLQLEISTLEIIPAGRIMFLPAFVVRAVRGEQAKIEQDTRLNASTRRHLLTQLKNLETAFSS